MPIRRAAGPRGATTPTLNAPPGGVELGGAAGSSQATPTAPPTWEIFVSWPTSTNLSGGSAVRSLGHRAPQSRAGRASLHQTGFGGTHAAVAPRFGHGPRGRSGPEGHTDGTCNENVMIVGRYRERQLMGLCGAPAARPVPARGASLARPTAPSTDGQRPRPPPPPAPT